MRVAKVLYRQWMGDQQTGHRTCSSCGEDCVPEALVDCTYGARIAFVCAAHGVHSIVEPFAEHQ